MSHYQVARDSQTLGEFDESQIQEGLQTGYFQPSDWCWREGMSEWQALETLQLAVPQPVQMLPRPTAAAAPAMNPYAAPRSGMAGRLPQASSRNYVEKASPGARLGAHVLDILVMFVCFLPAGLMDGMFPKDGDLAVTISLGLLGIICLTNLVLIAKEGQTIGKKLVGIRIAENGDSAKAGFIQIVFLRTLVGRLLLSIVPLYGLIDALYVFSEDRRCLHDKIGGTHVVKV